MKAEPLLIIGSKQANAFVGSCDDYSPCITSACGMGGDDSDDNRDCVPKEYTIVQRVGDRDKVAYSFKPYAFTIPSNPMSDRMQMVIELCYEDRESAQRTD